MTEHKFDKAGKNNYNFPVVLCSCGKAFISIRALRCHIGKLKSFVETPPKPQLITIVHSKRNPIVVAYTKESVDALIEWYDKKLSEADIELEWLRTKLKEMRK
jgi:hypothetical protein